MPNEKINGYDLSKQWFKFCFENVGIINPNHTALYFFCVELCNSLGWIDKFGLPTQLAMQAMGIKNWRTYDKALNELVSFGFINLYQKSKNQYTSNIIGIVKNAEANEVPLYVPLYVPLTVPLQNCQKHGKRHGQKHGSHNKTNKTIKTNKTKNIIINQTSTNENYMKFLDWMNRNCPNLLRMQKQMTEENFMTLKESYTTAQITDKLLSMENTKDIAKKYVSVFRTLTQWLKREYK